MFEQLIRPEPKPAPVRLPKQVRVKGTPDYPPVDNPWDLTPAQCAVLNAMCEGGRGGHEVAQFLGMARKTVAEHLFRARQKMEARNTTHACVLWDRAVRQVN